MSFEQRSRPTARCKTGDQLVFRSAEASTGSAVGDAAPHGRAGVRLLTVSLHVNSAAGFQIDGDIQGQMIGSW